MPSHSSMGLPVKSRSHKSHQSGRVQPTRCEGQTTQTRIVQRKDSQQRQRQYTRERAAAPRHRNGGVLVSRRCCLTQETKKPVHNKNDSISFDRPPRATASRASPPAATGSLSIFHFLVVFVFSIFFSFFRFLCSKRSVSAPKTTSQMCVSSSLMARCRRFLPLTTEKMQGGWAWRGARARAWRGRCTGQGYACEGSEEWKGCPRWCYTSGTTLL